MALQISREQLDAYLDRRIERQQAWARENGKTEHPRAILRSVIIENMLYDLLSGIDSVEEIRAEVQK